MRRRSAPRRERLGGVSSCCSRGAHPTSRLPSRVLRNERAGALVVQGDPFFDSERNALIAFARRHGVPAIYHIREFPLGGGLVSYGPSLVDGYEQLGAIAGRVLKGERPADLPVMRPTKFELVINMKTANALRVEVPLHLQQLADEVIE